MTELMYMVFSWDDYEDEEIFLYMSAHKSRAVKWAEEHYNRTEYHTWVKLKEINLDDFDPYDYCNYIPNDKSIVWERKAENEAV